VAGQVKAEGLATFAGVAVDLVVHATHIYLLAYADLARDSGDVDRYQGSKEEVTRESRRPFTTIRSKGSSARVPRRVWCLNVCMGWRAEDGQVAIPDARDSKGYDILA
jgi:hypothetical protein